MPEKQTIIVSKHGLAISRWVNAEHKRGNYQHIDNIAIDTRARGSINEETNVIGTIPFDLAENCHQYYGVKFIDRPASANGDMTAEQMIESRAYLQPYTVFPVSRAYILDVIEHHLSKLIDYIQANPVAKIGVKDVSAIIIENLSK